MRGEKGTSAELAMAHGTEPRAGLPGAALLGIGDAGAVSARVRSIPGVMWRQWAGNQRNVIGDAGSEA